MPGGRRSGRASQELEENDEPNLHFFTPEPHKKQQSKPAAADFPPAQEGSGVKRKCRSLDNANVQFRAWQSTTKAIHLPHLNVLPSFSLLSDAGKQLCCAAFFRNIWA